MNRLILIARNDHFPALSDGAHQKARPVTPATRCAPAPSPVLQDARLGAPFLPGRTAPQLGPRFDARAPSFDATAEQWIVPPPGMTPGSGAAADLRHSEAAHTRPAVHPLPTAGRPSIIDAVSEALIVAAGLTVFGLVAGFFLVLA